MEDSTKYEDKGHKFIKKEERKRSKSEKETCDKGGGIYNKRR
jgi:hypothetical protein